MYMSLCLSSWINLQALKQKLTTIGRTKTNIVL